MKFLLLLVSYLTGTHATTSNVCDASKQIHKDAACCGEGSSSFCSSQPIDLTATEAGINRLLLNRLEFVEGIYVEFMMNSMAFEYKDGKLTRYSALSDISYWDPARLHESWWRNTTNARKDFDFTPTATTVDTDGVHMVQDTMTNTLTTGAQYNYSFDTYPEIHRSMYYTSIQFFKSKITYGRKHVAKDAYGSYGPASDIYYNGFSLITEKGMMQVNGSTMAWNENGPISMWKTYSTTNIFSV